MLKSSKKVKTIAPSIITSGMHVNGGIIGEGAIEIGGIVDGEVKCLSVKLEKGATVNGDITAEKIEVHGNVKGNLTAKAIICGSTAKILGDITHQRIHIEDGADINGNCRKFIPDEPKSETENKSDDTSASEDEKTFETYLESNAPSETATVDNKEKELADA